LNYYVGHPQQTRGAEKYVLQGGKGEGMHFLYVRNGLGLEAWLSLDRCGDLARVTFEGRNMGFFSPCGYVAPQYFDKEGTGFLKSFNAGFVTTCGLAAVGAACIDEGEALPLHGTVSHIPAELDAVLEDENALTVQMTVRDCVLFGRKLVLRRKYTFSYTENKITVEDLTTNEADTTTPFMILYHCNLGYPLLSENSTLKIPNIHMEARDPEAEQYIDTALCMEKPQAGFKERCYYYDMAETNGVVHAGIYNNDIEKGMVLSFLKSQLPYLTEWKMMGQRDYALGLEPGNCTPDGRDVLRKNGQLQFLAPAEQAKTAVTFSFVSSRTDFDATF
jgi:galactose mutarotase-like enzyme